MAKLVAKITLGIDVAKDQLVICNWNSDELLSIANDANTINNWLRTLTGPVRIALEPTSHYHLAVVEAAQDRGHQIYLVNARQLVHYRQAVNVRHKTDPQDAWLLARYLEHEAAQLRPFQPQDRRAQRLWGLILRRAIVIKSRQQLTQSFSGSGVSIKGLLTHYQYLVARIERQMLILIRELGWWFDYLRCHSIPGVGPITACALTVAYHRGAFASGDAFVAYLGLDVRVRESGYYKGKRKLTKRGEPELRRLLYCGSHGARSYHLFASYYQRQLEKGLCKTAARVVLARKIVRIAFALLRNEESFIDSKKSIA